MEVLSFLLDVAIGCGIGFLIGNQYWEHVIKKQAEGATDLCIHGKFYTILWSKRNRGRIDED